MPERTETKTAEYEHRLAEIEQMLNMPAEQLDESIVRFTSEHDSATEKKTIGLAIHPVSEGYINSQSEIKRNFLFTGFKVDDPNIYKELVFNINEMRAQGWDKYTLREMIPTAIQYTLTKYFGMSPGDESGNRNFYIEKSDENDDEQVHLSELKGKGLAVCAEHATAAQNLLQFCGMESTLVFAECQLGGEEKDNTGHAYNIISSDHGKFIYDPNNPKNILSGNSLRAVPTIFKLTSEQYNSLTNGGEVSVDWASWSIKDSEPLETKHTFTYRYPKQKQ